MKIERVIGIKGLKVNAHVGVPDAERETAQILHVDLSFAAMTQPLALHDDLAQTVDYHAVSLRVANIAADHPRKLIETLADELADRLIPEFSLRWIEVTIRKFILPESDWVSASVRREVANDG
ncbi:MAG: dihydroneopterin aldolase [Verrucomicrobiota bacterium]|jgi:dihydroneopterin aldolase